jgi:hypothetical protein
VSKILHVVLKDDLNGETGSGVVEHTFALDADLYEVELSNASYMELQRLLAPYIAVARRRKRRRVKTQVKNQVEPQAEPKKTAGKRGGRRRKLNDRDRSHVLRDCETGMPVKDIAAKWGISSAYVYQLRSDKHRRRT